MKRARRRREGRKRPSAFFSDLPSLDALARTAGRRLLVPPSRAYGLIRRLDALLYDRGLRRRFHPEVPTVAVGGMTADCRGRVLLTSWLLGWAASRGVATAVICPRREAGSPELPLAVRPGQDPWECGLEAALLGRYTPDGHILVDADPVRAAKAAVSRFRPELLVLQDGLTECRLGRDISLAILEVRDLGPDWDRPLPAGPWRGDVSFLARATAFCVYAGPLGLPAALLAADKRLSAFGRPVFGMTFDIWRFRGPAGPVAASAIAAEPYIAVLGESDREILPELRINVRKLSPVRNKQSKKCFRKLKSRIS